MAKTTKNGSKFFHSIVFRLILVPTIGLLAAMGSGIAATMILHTILGDQNADATLTKAVGEYSNEFDSSIIQITNAVDSARVFFENSFSDVSSLTETAKVEEFSDHLHAIFTATMADNVFSCCHWMVVNPEYSGQTAEDPTGVGFFCVANKETGVYSEQDVTNILAYRKDDAANVSWWYEVTGSDTNPNKKSVWMEPYYNANITRNLITYASPCFDDAGKLLGAVGVDLDFDTIESIIARISEFKDPRYFLLNKDMKFLSSPLPSIVTKDKDGHYVPTDKTLESEFGDVLQHYGSMNTYFYKRYDPDLGEQNRALSYGTLKNGFIYGISVDATALYDPVNRTTFICIIIFVSASIAVAILMALYANKQLAPLRRLTNEVAKLKEGEKTIEITVGGSGEIGDLSQEVHDMVDTLRMNQSALEALAEKDGLTGVKNTNAQKEKVVEINRRIQNREKPEFAIIMADMNDLKHINDNLGHPEGDFAIRKMCYVLCHIFTHSPVYRIGGDEFIIIAEGEDYENRETLFEELRTIALDTSKIKHTFSVGLAVFHSDIDHSFEEVFARADDNMYEMKQNYKKSRNENN